MTTPRLAASLAILLLLPAAPIGGVASAEPPFGRVARIDEVLTVGVSTAPDVAGWLGEPEGRGGLRLPRAFLAHSAWLYRESEVGSERHTPDGVVADARERVLIVLFEGERYAGYLWWGARFEGLGDP